MNKRFNTETTADDLLMLPDIDGIVKDIRGQKTISGQSKTEVKTEQPEEAPAETWKQLGGVPQMQPEL